MTPLFVGEWRACHNTACERSYTVEHPTHYHCSDACAAVCLKRRSYGLLYVDAGGEA